MPNSLHSRRFRPSKKGCASEHPKFQSRSLFKEPPSSMFRKLKLQHPKFIDTKSTTLHIRKGAGSPNLFYMLKHHGWPLTTSNTPWPHQETPPKCTATIHCPRLAWRAGLKALLTMMGVTEEVGLTESVFLRLQNFSWGSIVLKDRQTK